MEDVEVPRPLSAKFKGDFAYITVKDRMPVILTKAIDVLHRMKDEIKETLGMEALEELKAINGHLSKLRNELQTDKPLEPLVDGLPDVELWNAYLDNDSTQQGADGSRWFSSPWLYIECYFYRRMKQAVQLSTQLKSVDYFGAQKRNALMSSQAAMETLASHIIEQMTLFTTASSSSLFKPFLLFLEVALWGNKCDLSISSGVENSQKLDPLAQIEPLKSFQLCDDSKQVWQCLLRILDHKNGQLRVDIILDNAGFELFSDLIFAEFLVVSGLAKTVHMHGKMIPWFVSDVTKEDLDWTLEQLAFNQSECIANLGKKWKQRLEDKSWVYKADWFWTSPHDFSEMKAVAPHLYAELEKSDFIFFKGDLNYRKLSGDRTWNHTTPFPAVLRGFLPAPLCALRTLKSDLAIGMKEGQAENVEKISKDWMLTGQFAVIHFCDK